MSPTLLYALLLGTGTGLGLLLVIVGLRGRAVDAPATEPGTGWWGRFDPRRQPHGLRRPAIAVVVGVGLGVLTGWPVAVVLGALAVWVVPAMVGPDRDHARQLARVEAVATWTEALRDTLSAAAGLEQAIVATAATAPEAIRADVHRLVARLDGGYRLPAALRAFASDLSDATGDLVVAALVMAAERHGRQLAELLSDLSVAAREQAALRLRVMAGRARIRTSVRVVVGVTVAMAGGLVAFNRSYLHPFDSAFGQLMLLVIGLLFGTSFLWMAKMSQFSGSDRLLTNLDDLSGAKQSAVVS